LWFGAGLGLVLIPIRSLLYWALRYFQFLSNSIADERLKRAVKDCWRVFDTVEDMMTKIWLYIRPPTSSERKWAATSHGDTRSEDLFRIYYRYRKAFLGEVRRKNKIWLSKGKHRSQTLEQKSLRV
jgi:hypothetical protein